MTDQPSEAGIDEMVRRLEEVGSLTEQFQAELSTSEYAGQDHDRLVTVTVHGDPKAPDIRVAIDQAAMSDGPEALASRVSAAFSAAMTRVRAVTESYEARLTALAPADPWMSDVDRVADSPDFPRPS